MNYEIIKDIKILESFVDWLPATKEHETFYVALLARNKYVRDLGIGTFNSDRHQCARFLSTKDRLIDKIKALECPVGVYKVKDFIVPQEALALYITPNPRDNVKATKASLIKFAELITQDSKCHSPHQEVISQVHKSVGTKHIVDFDFDDVEPADILHKVNEFMTLDSYSVVKTRGGFHLIVHLNKIDSGMPKDWYKRILSLGVDAKGDTLLPVPGCTQGNFTPFIYHSYSNPYRA